MARWSFGLGSGNCCADCIIFDDGILAQYTGFDFDDNWLVYNDISQENMDLTALSGGAVILNTNAATYSAASVGLYCTAATAAFTVGETFRIIIAATDNVGSAADYVYAEFSRTAGQNLTYTLGYRASDVDTVLDSVTDSEFGYDKINQTNGTRWKLCYTGESLESPQYTLRLTRQSLFLGGWGNERGLVESVVPSAGRTGLGKRFGITSSDWSDTNVTPLSINTTPAGWPEWGTSGATYAEHKADVSGREDVATCWQCVPLPKPDPCLCSRDVSSAQDGSQYQIPDFALVTTKAGELILPRTSEDTFSGGVGVCIYEETFTAAELGLQPCDACGWTGVYNVTQVKFAIETQRSDLSDPTKGTASLQVTFQPSLQPAILDFVAFDQWTNPRIPASNLCNATHGSVPPWNCPQGTGACCFCHSQIFDVVEDVDFFGSPLYRYECQVSFPQQ